MEQRLFLGLVAILLVLQVLTINHEGEIVLVEPVRITQSPTNHDTPHLRYSTESPFGEDPTFTATTTISGSVSPSAPPDYS